MSGTFQSDGSSVKDEPYFDMTMHSCCTIKRRVLIICVNQQITIRELCKELNTGFSVLEVMVVMLEYQKVCARWVPQMLTQ